MLTAEFLSQNAKLSYGGVSLAPTVRIYATLTSLTSHRCSTSGHE